MGQTIQKVAETELPGKQVFDNRFVVEICEAVHVHYRNLRILMSVGDWVEMAKGMADSLKRWEQRGKPEPAQGVHIELCRKNVGVAALGEDTVKVNLNKNLYAENEGKVFAEGAGLTDSDYVHLKLWDLRLELTREQYKAVRNAILEAEL